MGKRILLAIAVLALSAFAARMKAFNSFAHDTRSKVISRHAPWSAIGKLFVPGGGWCTGTLVGRNLVLTAAHCVIDEKTKRLMPGTFTFYPGYKDGRGHLASTANYAWWGTTDPSSQRGDDWAFLRLRDNLGDSAGWMGVRAIDLRNHLHEGRFYIAGYSSDFLEGNSASWEQGCAFTKLDASDNTFYHNGDSSRGASGGPIFDFDDRNQPGAGNYIVALDVAEFRDGGEDSLLHVRYSDRTANIAVPATAFIKALNKIKAGE